MSTLVQSWGNLWYADSGGSAVPLVFLHGTGCDSEDWQGVIAALPANARTICVDFRGHGRSDVPATAFTLSDLAADVIAVADELALDRLVLVGHSLGGMVGMAVASRLRAVAGLVLLEGWTRLGVGNAFQGKRAYGNLEEGKSRTIKQKDADMRRQIKPEVWSVFWESVKNADGLPFLEATMIPVAEVYGGMGRTEGTLERLMIPSNRMIRQVWIEGAGHYLPHERPQEVAEVCEGILKQVEG